jgi:hypothetical protein
MIDEASLREGLKKLLAATEADIRARVEEEPALKQALEARHKAAAEAGRTAPGAWLAFRDEEVTQAAAHWLLASVFVRFMEDNDLVAEVRISGPKTNGRDRLNEALDRRSIWYQQNPRGNDADYLLDVFARTAELPGMAGLFDHAHNPLWSLAPTGTQAMAILHFFQNRDDATSELRHDFTDPEWNTRFLGDLYQNLSEFARKRYALCQTPGFVVDFILDRTLTPALDVFGLEQTRLIDPTCGSGHFLLAAFDRLFAKWVEREPAGSPRVLAQRGLDAVYGVDLNPFAVEIAEFRLLVAALRICGVKRLKDAPDFRFQLAAGDSLLHGSPLKGESAIQRPMGQDPTECFFAAEDAEALRRILGQQYHAVVGNPPYINVADPALRETYRQRYTSCAGKYQLSVPFTERSFHLATRGGDTAEQPAGFVGLIVSNAFMKRSFGKKLIENQIRLWDLTHVIDTSGVYLPGHGTPTAVLFGRNQPPVANTVRAVRGIRGETTVPSDPASAPVWSAIVAQVGLVGSESKWVSVADAPRDSFASHPWSIGGGGAAELRELLEETCQERVSDIVAEVGFASFPGLDDAFFISPTAQSRFGITCSLIRGLILGDCVRDWEFDPPQLTVTPYDDQQKLRSISDDPALALWFWPNRKQLKSVLGFGGKTIGQLGLPWWGWYRWIPERYANPLSLAFGHVDFQSRFVLSRGGHVFNQHSPVIKLEKSTSEDDHVALLGILNSSLICFWLKQVCFPKGGDTVGQDGARVRKVLWDVYYEFDNTRVKQIPIPPTRPVKLALAIQSEADARTELFPDRICAGAIPTSAAVCTARQRAAAHLARMIALQEELDWQVYHLYGLLDEDLSLPLEEVPPLKLGERPFEIVMARQIAAGELETTWFERHGSSPITELPAWPEKYRRAVEHRLEITATNRDIALIEQPEYKRRWSLPKWEDLERKALENWLLDRMESAALWADPELKSCSRLADLLRRDPEFAQVAEMLEGRPDYDIAALVKRLALKQAVPFLPVLRYKPSGMEKRLEWEKTWELQRREDAGDKVEIPVPPKYRSADFQDAIWWSLRGSLDVPKERFILYSGLEGASDSSPVIGWAGWDHLKQAQALTAYYQHLKEQEGLSVERLKPALAGLLDTIPWLKQWHNEPDPATGDRMGDSFASFLEAECQELGITVDSLQEWTPARTARAGRRRG